MPFFVKVVVQGQTALGRKGRNMKRFLEVYNFVNNSIFQNPFTDRQTNPLEICHSNISARNLVRGEIFLLKSHPFLDQGHIMKHFGPFWTGIYIISTEFLGS